VPAEKLGQGASGRDIAPQGTPAFHTDDGRLVTVGGGITPDVPLPSRSDDPWMTFLNQRGYMTSYAESYLTTHGRPAEPFDISPEMLEDFKASLERNGVRVPDEYWQADQDRLKVRLRVELTSLVYGLVQGEEVETRSDPQAQQAARLFPRVAEILSKP
jgi:hypothetical protein